MSEPKRVFESIADICNSKLADGIAMALIILALSLGIGGCIYLEGAAKVKSEEIRK